MFLPVSLVEVLGDLRSIPFYPKSRDSSPLKTNVSTISLKRIKEKIQKGTPYSVFLRAQISHGELPKKKVYVCGHIDDRCSFSPVRTPSFLECHPCSWTSRNLSDFISDSRVPCRREEPVRILIGDFNCSQTTHRRYTTLERSIQGPGELRIQDIPTKRQNPQLKVFVLNTTGTY